MSVALLTYMGWGIIILIGYVKEFLLSFVPSQNPERNREVGSQFQKSVFMHVNDSSCFQGYAPLYSSFESFYTRNVYRPIRDCWNRPICSVPGAELVLKDRVTHDNGWTFKLVIYTASLGLY